MDFSIIFQLRNKKFWWLDVIFYFVTSLLIAVVFCYLIFVAKIAMQNKAIKDIDVKFQEVGTQQQKDYEKSVIFYQKKIVDFAGLIKNHQLASAIFGFMEKETLPNVWFNSFALNRKEATVNLSGSADNVDVLSRQTALLEKNEYIKKIGVLNTQANATGGIKFNLNIALDPKIFTPILLLETTTSNN